MRKIALIKCKNVGEFEKIIDKITDFEDVTDEEFKALQWYENKSRAFSIIELVQNQREKVEFSVKKYIEFCKEQQMIEDSRKADLEKKRIAKQLKGDLKKEADRKRLFEQLKTEFGKE